MKIKNVILYIGLALLVGIVLYGIGDAFTIKGCTFSKYKAEASPIMERVGAISNELVLSDEASRERARENLLILQLKINQVECKNDYPLKHETLEYSVKHFLDALDYADQGDFEKVNQSLNYAIINIERFNDWSVDMGE